MKIKLSVHDVVDFILRSGSLISASALNKRAVSGTRLHKKIQSRHSKKASKKGFFFDEEFVLKNRITIRDYEIEIEGRADGVVETEDNVYIEEIKSTVREISQIKQDDIIPAHLAQLRCYGYMYFSQFGKENVGLYLTYCDTEGKNEITFEYHEDIKELEKFYFRLLEEYCQWVDYYMKLYGNFVETAKKLGFPYGNFRKGQRELSAAVYNTLVSEKQFFVQAPTGTGKTISTLFPSVKYLSRYGSPATKLFYTTAKNQTRNVAEDTVFSMREKGLCVKSVTLSAKAKICTRRQGACSTDNCIYAKGHFDRVNECIRDILDNVDIIKKEDIVFYAEKHIVCPFELELDLTLFAHIIICDYNYIYDPSVQLCRFFDDSSKMGKPVLLIDEAHNFPDRTRDMYTADINTGEIKDAAACFGRMKPAKVLKGLKKLIAEKTAEDREVIVDNKLSSEITQCMQEFIYAADSFIEKNPDIKEKDKILDFYFRINDFIKITDYFGDNYRVIYKRINSVDVEMKIFCADASKIISDINKKIKSVICFSATFEPLDYYVSMCGGGEDSNKALTASPFPSENLLVLCDTGISTRYRKREESYEKIAERIYIMTKCRKGNYFAFFTSYSYMNRVYEIFKERYGDIHSAIQESFMTEEDGTQFLKKFEMTYKNSFIAFAVLGGIFSEGIDLKYDRLIGAAVIGVGLPQICTERDIMSEYYGKNYGRGFDYAYRFPGMNKVLQAAGRVIRTENDRGIILLIDDRFADSGYRRLLPAFWKNVRYISSGFEANDEIERFWNKDK